MLVQRGARILYSRSLFFSSGPFLLLLYYFLLCLGRTAADCPAVKNHGGGDCDAMIFAAARAIFWPTGVFGVCSEFLFVLTRFTCGNTFAAAQAIFWPTRVFGVCSECLFVLTRFTSGQPEKIPYILVSTRACPRG